MFWVEDGGVEARVHHDGFCMVKTCLFPIHLHRANPIHSSDSSLLSSRRMRLQVLSRVTQMDVIGPLKLVESGARGHSIFGAGSLPKSRCGTVHSQKLSPCHPQKVWKARSTLTKPLSMRLQFVAERSQVFWLVWISADSPRKMMRACERYLGIPNRLSIVSASRGAAPAKCSHACQVPQPLGRLDVFRSAEDLEVFRSKKGWARPG